MGWALVVPFLRFLELQCGPLGARGGFQFDLGKFEPHSDDFAATAPLPWICCVIANDADCTVTPVGRWRAGTPRSGYLDCVGFSDLRMGRS